MKNYFCAECGWRGKAEKLYFCPSCGHGDAQFPLSEVSDAWMAIMEGPDIPTILCHDCQVGSSTDDWDANGDLCPKCNSMKGLLVKCNDVRSLKIGMRIHLRGCG
jgi:Zn finger protein HypA/HybF involved in hydrogenase expression